MGDKTSLYHVLLKQYFCFTDFQQRYIVTTYRTSINKVSSADIMIPYRLQLVVALVVLCAATGLGLSVHQKCFPHCPKVEALLPNPRNCSEYYQCDDALHPILMPCPIKTVFVPSIGKCDWASLHHCIPDPDAPCSTTNAPSITPSTTPSTTPSSTTTKTTSHSTATAKSIKEDVDHHKKKCHVDCSSGFPSETVKSFLRNFIRLNVGAVRD